MTLYNRILQCRYIYLAIVTRSERRYGYINIIEKYFEEAVSLAKGETPVYEMKRLIELFYSKVSQILDFINRDFDETYKKSETTQSLYDVLCKELNSICDDLWPEVRDIQNLRNAKYLEESKIKEMWAEERKRFGIKNWFD